jgi:transcription initiation factor TFIIIB Brf1 subunit/transcription initiation factor TFIIB
MDLEEEIWKIAFSSKKSNSKDAIEQSGRCSNCESDNIMYDCSEGNVCGDCGLVINKFIELSSYSFEETDPYKQSKLSSFSPQNSRLRKIQEWMSWTNTEKNEYKLKKYTRELCEQLHIYENIIEGTCELVVKVMNTIKDKNDGPKRSRVKDGIIISCIYYISKDNNITLNYLELAKKINLDIKYVSKADKILLELNFLNDKIINKTENPCDYITNVIKKYSLHNRINNIEALVEKTRVLIDICEDNDILLDHTPLSIGCSCFYYILLKTQSIDIDLKMFADMFGLSSVTIIKTFNKLKSLENKIDKLVI